MEITDLIDWDGAENHLLLNPRLPAPDHRRLVELAALPHRLDAHVLIATSGSAGDLELAAISKAALLSSAAAVNAHLRAISGDRWCLALPVFHVGGLGILARAQLSGSTVLPLDRWNAVDFASLCRREKITLASLVPAQVADLVSLSCQSPEGLRAVVVGGGPLPPARYAEARKLGWNLLPSYGMTECGSQVATASLASLRVDQLPELEILDHIEARREAGGELAFAGPSLFTGYLSGDGRSLHDPKVDGWFISGDVGTVEQTTHRRVIHFEGRRTELVKIGGESVNLARLDAVLELVVRECGRSFDAAVVAVSESRLGHVIHLAVDLDGEPMLSLVREEFNRRVLPFERARVVHLLPSIPRGALGKLRRSELVRQLTGLT